MSRSEGRIFLNGAAKVVQRLVAIRLSTARQCNGPSYTGRGLRFHRSGAASVCCSCGVSLTTNLLRHRPRNLPLECQNAADVAVVAVRPCGPVVRCINELHCDPHLIARSQHRTRQHRVDIQLARDFGHRLLRALIASPRIAKRLAARRYVTDRRSTPLSFPRQSSPVRDFLARFVSGSTAIDVRVPRYWLVAGTSS